MRIFEDLSISFDKILAGGSSRTCEYLSWVLVGVSFPRIQVSIFSAKILVDPTPSYLWIHSRTALAVAILCFPDVIVKRRCISAMAATIVSTLSGHDRKA